MVFGPNGQVLGVWKTHNILVEPGISYVAACLSGQILSCPNPNTPFTSFTSGIGVGIGGCATAFIPNGAGNTLNNCAVQATTAVTPTPSGCVSSASCTGWLASATFGATDIENCTTNSGKCCPGPGYCFLNDVAAELNVPIVGILQFDEICTPVGSCPAGAGNLPTIQITPGDSLAINIQFTVS